MGSLDRRVDKSQRVKKSIIPTKSAGQRSVCPARSDGGDAFRLDRRRRRQQARGFTLLEVLIAFAILALAMTALMQTFGSGMRGVEASERHLTAALMARSLLDRVGHDIPLEPGEIKGASGLFAWTVSVRPAASTDRQTSDELTVIPYAVLVTVGWPGSRAITLESYRLAPVPGKAP